MRHLIALAVCGVAVAFADQTTTPLPSIPYSKSQANSGKKVYAAQCALCHGAELSGGGAPELKGEKFLKKWRKNTLDDFHYIMKSTMPQTNPGGLTDTEYLNLVAFVLSENGFKAGMKKLAMEDLKKHKFGQ